VSGAPEAPPLRAVVVEDEPPARRHLCDLLAAMPGVEVVAAAEHGEAGLAAIARHRPDVAFLDVAMPGLTGTEVMHRLPAPRPALVFVTASPEHAVEAFAGGAIHYLLKPISATGLAQALSRVRPADDPRQVDWLRVPARRRGVTRLLRPGEIEALTADLGDCAAWTADGRWPVDGTLAHWEERLGGQGFLRVHRNALVRLAAVREVTADGALLLPGGRLEVSRRRLEEVRRRLGLGG